MSLAKKQTYSVNKSSATKVNQIEEAKEINSMNEVEILEKLIVDLNKEYNKIVMNLNVIYYIKIFSDSPKWIRDQNTKKKTWKERKWDRNRVKEIEIVEEVENYEIDNNIKYINVL